MTLTKAASMEGRGQKAVAVGRRVSGRGGKGKQIQGSISRA